eukprot:167029-Pelagomonas_calceolata.AAC.2
MDSTLQRWILIVLRNLLGVKTITPSWSLQKFLKNMALKLFNSIGVVPLCVPTTRLLGATPLVCFKWSGTLGSDEALNHGL